MRALIAIAAVVVFATGCGGSSDESMRSAAQPTTVENPARPAPTIEGVALDGERISLAGLRGTAVFVNVWSSW